jgi:hypothetical protein
MTTTVETETYSPAEYKALLRTDFASFARHSFHELNPRTPFAPGWHHEVIAAKLAAVREGHIRRLIINKPYLFDYIECIFHPPVRERAIAVCRRIRVECENEGALSSEIWESGLGVCSIPVAISR